MKRYGKQAPLFLSVSRVKGNTTSTHPDRALAALLRAHYTPHFCRKFEKSFLFLLIPINNHSNSSTTSGTSSPQDTHNQNSQTNNQYQLS